MLSPLDHTMMNRALDLARTAAALNEVPIAAIIYNHQTGDLLAEAHNRRELDKDPLAHAELLAIHAAAKKLGDWRLTSCTLAVTLEPCPMCAGAVVNARIDRLLYAAPDPKAGACGSLMRLTEDPRLNHRTTPIPTGDPHLTQSANLLRDFFQRLRTS